MPTDDVVKAARAVVDDAFLDEVRTTSMVATRLIDALRVALDREEATALDAHDAEVFDRAVAWCRNVVAITDADRKAALASLQRSGVVVPVGGRGVADTSGFLDALAAHDAEVRRLAIEGRLMPEPQTVRVAALYVLTNGPYFGLSDVEPWDQARDARLYAGPFPVVAHPPCERWGKYWHGGPNSAKFPRERKVKGDDGGCFAAALAAVRRWGGVLEHPADSAAWKAFGLMPPPVDGGWVSADWVGGWTCRVEQGHYGHRAKKGTWLYACGVSSLPSLRWGPSRASVKLDDGYHSAAERRAHHRSDLGCIERMGKRERAETPAEFKELLLSIARGAREPARRSVG